MNNRNFRRAQLLSAASLAALCLAGLSACRYDDDAPPRQPAHERTERQTEIRTPEGKTTTTEVHEHDTRVYPK